MVSMDEARSNGTHEGDNNNGSGSSNRSSEVLGANYSGTVMTEKARLQKIKEIESSHVSPGLAMYMSSLAMLTPEQGAFDKVRVIQGILHSLTTSLRRMPGVSSAQANEIIDQLQEVGRITTTETSNLVNAIACMMVDHQDSNEAAARLCMEITLARARIDDLTSQTGELRNEVLEERNKRQLAECDVKKIMGELHDLNKEFNTSTGRDELIDHFQDTIKHLEDQVNNRRSLWVMKHPDPESVARAMKTLTASAKDVALRTKGEASQPNNAGPGTTRAEVDETPTHRPPSAFQPPSGQSLPPPRLGALTAGPPRAPSVAPREPRRQDWAPQPPPNRPASAAPMHQTPSGYGRPPSARRNTRYRPNAPDFQPSGLGAFANNDYQGNRQAYSNYGHGANPHQHTPSSHGRSRHNSFRYANSPASGSDYGSHSRANNNNNNSRGANNVNGVSNTSNGGNVNNSRPNAVGPLIVLNEQSVADWNAQVIDLYGQIRTFVERSAHLPEVAPLTELTSAPLWSILLDTYRPLSPEQATAYLTYHLQQENSKSCLVTRLMVDFIVNRILTAAAWVGFDTEIDFAIIDLEKDLQLALGQASSVRQPLLDRQANIVNSVTTSTRGPQWIRRKMEGLATTMTYNLKPLLNDFVDTADAYNDLLRIVENAWELGTKILTSRLTFDFRFPEIGSRYSSQSMVPIWPLMDPMELQSQHWRVALVTTPVITCRNDTGTNISAHSVCLADVFCMQ
ncbi:hypothetical protein S40288_01684 [Stachybotrys chartarum IBT 40288]|nr:hypothetical protein S40288_01684 [Stachybotrys chartarum IBT 40288]